MFTDMAMWSVVSIGLSFGFFALIHSFTTGRGMKAILTRRTSQRSIEGWYRLAYNFFSFVTILPCVIFVFWLPDQQIYLIGFPWWLLFILVRILGAFGLLAAAISIDILRFAEIRQVTAYMKGQSLPLADELLQQRGVYSLSRHPLYVFSLVILWAAPVMTLNVLSFNICATAYFLIGSLIEERRLKQAYGDEYTQYQQRVPWMIPKIRRG